MNPLMHADMALAPAAPTSSPAPRPGDFAVVSYHRPGVIARVTSAVTTSIWTHALTYLDDRDGGRYGEAAPGGYRIVSAREYEGNSHLMWSSTPLTDEQRDALTDFHHRLLGRPYAYPDIAAHLFAAFGIRPEPLWRALSRHGQLTCSEAIAIGFQGVGVDLLPGGRTRRATPADLARAILTRSYAAAA